MEEYVRNTKQKSSQILILFIFFEDWTKLKNTFWNLTTFNICFWKQVYTEGRLIVEFTFDDMMRIRSWHFAVRNHRELIPR